MLTLRYICWIEDNPGDVRADHLVEEHLRADPVLDSLRPVQVSLTPEPQIPVRGSSGYSLTPDRLQHGTRS